MSAAAKRLREYTDSVPLPENDPHRMICRQLKLVTSSLVRRVDRHMQPLELTGMQWEPLLMLWLGRADTVAALARVIQMGDASMSRMLDRLEEKDLVRRERSEADRRVVQYGGEILPLLDVDTALRAVPPSTPSSGAELARVQADPNSGELGSDKEAVQVVVHAQNERLVGLIVERILDIVEQDSDVQGPSSRPGVVSTAVIQGHVTEMLDVERLIQTLGEV